MANEINAAFRLPHIHVGDPAILLEQILQQVEAPQRAQVTNLVLDHMTAVLQAQLKLVEGIRAAVGR